MQHNRILPAVAVFAAVCGNTALANETDAKQILQSMSDYMSGLDGMSFEYDATLEVVTTEDQIVGIASSGSVDVARPNRIHATRTGGFADVEMAYDGKTFGIVGKNANVYADHAFAGSIDEMFDELGKAYGIPFPAADLLYQNPYDLLMEDVNDIKDLGVGVIGGRVCDHLAFRTSEVDWQIWIAQGDQPYPCRYEITTRDLTLGPGYRVDLHDWQGGAVAEDSAFILNLPRGASKITLKELEAQAGLLPQSYQKGEN